MPVQRIKGLDGLKGLNEISDRERELFLRENASKLAKYADSPMSYSIAAERIYNNQKFKDIFGIDKFSQLNDNTKASYDYRNSLLKEFIVNREVAKYSPYDNNGIRNNNKGAGEYWEKLNELSTDGKLKVMESNWLTPSEFENKWQSDYKAHLNDATGKNGAWRMMGVLGGSTPLTPMIIEEDKFGEAAKKRALDVNSKIFDKIYNDDTDVESNRLSPQVEDAYYSPEIANMTDKQVKQAFIKAIYGDRSKGDMGIPEFASHYGNGSKEQVTSEMLNFSIDEMREILAKRKVYYENMSPNMAATALNNEAKRYITNHQGKLKRFGLFLKDVGISSMSYTADKLNGVGEIYRMGQDLLAEKPIVYVDDNNSIIDPNKVKIYQGKGGILYYQDKNGQQHSIHKEQVDYTTLHNLGKNEDGSDIKGAFGWDWMTLNPLYWNRAEQFGTLDEAEQKQYEKIGSSPYKVSYNPNDEGDLWYEAFKMASFGIADGLSQLIPYGIGTMGKALSTASKVGKVARGFGKVLDGAGKMLTAETKVGQVLQGTTGALGISYAYNRGTFSETLQQNIENMEGRISNQVRNNIYNRYNSDKEYKNYIDSKVDAAANALKKEYLSKKQIEGGAKIVDMQLTEKMLRAKAQDAVLAEEVANGIAKFKETKDYVNMQQRAIDGAGDAAFNTFWPEAIKYGFVNNLGHRKFLYQNPAGVTRNLSQSLKGLKEITTSAGRKRLATETSKFLTRKDKLKQLGKVALSQAWGGAWTNGTDDMQVDAAERINEDSFNRYLDAWENGDAMATTYGYTDGLYSYFKGLQNSLGQETTWNAALVGGLGSIVNVTPNFTNIASLFTKQGRQFYKDNFRRSIIRNEETGEPLRTENGSIQYKNYSKWHDPLGQLSFFLQNGVLNTYYGKKQSERDLQSHADYVNNLLDEYNDFADIEKLVAANIASENLDNIGDEKTAMFLKALLAARTLNNLGNSSKDPTSMSSVVQNAKNLISRASELNLEEGKNPFSEEEISNLLSQYYAQNKGLEQSDENSQKALYNIAQNAQKLQEAAKAADAAEKEISKIEKNYGIEIDHQVKTKMILDQALGKHWRERREKMMSEIGDNSSEETTLEPSVMIATVGGRKNAQTLVKVYNKQQAEMEADLKEQQEKTAKLQKKYEEAVKATQEAQDTKDSKAILDATKAEKEAKAKLESSQQSEKLMEDMIVMTSNKRTALQDNIKEENLDSKQFRYSVANEQLSKYQERANSLKKKKARFFKKDGTIKKVYTDAEGNLKQKYADEIANLDKQIEAEEKNISSRTELVNKYKEKVLTADEIFALDPVTRARMMRTENRDLYSKEQQLEIEKLEQKLLVKDADALQKIQDIGLLTQRINSVEDAYTRMAKHPKAAAYEVENQRVAATNAAAKLINQRSAETLAEFINQMSETLKKLPDIPQAEVESTTYKMLRKHNSHLLDIIDQDNLLPNYAQQLKEAKEWAKTVEDIDAVIESMGKPEAEKESLKANIDRILKDSTSKEQIMSTLEKVVDDVDNPNAVKDFEQILEGMERLDYQRDATILESRKQRLEREAKEKEKREEERKRKEEEAKAAAELEAEKRNAEEGTEPIISNENLDENSLQDVDLDLGEGEEEANKGKGKGEQPKEGTKVTVAKTVRKHKYTPIGGTEMEMDVEENKVPLSELQAGDEYFGGNNVIYQVDKVLDDGRIMVHQRNDKKRTSLINPKDFENTELMWAKGGVDRIVKEETPQVEEKKKSNIVENEDEIYVRSETIEEQLQEELPSDKKAEIHTTDEGEDAEAENTTGQQNINTNPIYLSGTAIPEFKHEPLAKDGVLERRKGKEPNDKMNKYFNWMKAAGIKLQNITDHELARIIKVNPHAKVKFMVVRPDNNATHDYDMKTHLMIVLDYDNNINKGITSIHNKDNGGVIESNGKKYLIIGTVGYSKGNVDKLALYDILYGNNKSSKTGYGIMRKSFGKFFKDNPTERYYVNEEISTEIVPNYPTPGYIVRQMETDNSPKFRSIIELLASNERNPMHLELESIAWGIQEKSKFMLIGTTLDEVMTLRDPMENQGSAFALIPASNGKMLPIYLKVLKYAEMRDGTLKDKIYSLLQDVTSPNYQKRLDAAVALGDIFYFSKEGDFILLRKSKDEISLVHDGKVFKTFYLGSDFNRMEFIKAFEDMNPRVNITAKVLGSIERLREYDEAGALMTDAAMLATAGSSYSIYGLDAQGNMIKPTIQENSNTSTSSFKEKERSQIVYNYKYYREAGGVFYLDGKPVTDEDTNKQLNIIKRILDNGLASVESKGIFNYYILSSGEHPEVVKINRNTKEVKELAEEEAKALIKNIEEKKDKEKREQTAKKLMEKAKNGILPLVETKDVELDVDADFVVDPETGEIITSAAEEQIPNNEKDDTNLEGKEENTPSVENNTPKNIPPVNSNLPKDSTQNFQQLMKSIHAFKVLGLSRKKWKDAPKDVMGLEKFLREKGIQVDAIGTSENDVKTWLKTIEDCR